MKESDSSLCCWPVWIQIKMNYIYVAQTLFYNKAKNITVWSQRSPINWIGITESTFNSPSVLFYLSALNNIIMTQRVSKDGLFPNCFSYASFLSHMFLPSIKHLQLTLCGAFRVIATMLYWAFIWHYWVIYIPVCFCKEFANLCTGKLLKINVARCEIVNYLHDIFVQRTIVLIKKI